MKLSEIEGYRNWLLPKWLKFFLWLFLVFSFFSIPGILTMLLGHHVSVGIWGINYDGDGVNIIPALVFLVFILMGVTSYGLLWGRRWGLYFGLAIAALNIVMSIIGNSIAFMTQGVAWPIELLLFIPWLIKLWKIRKQWLLETPPEKMISVNGKWFPETAVRPIAN